MTTTVEIKGFETLTSTMEGIGANMTRAMQNAVEAAATEMHTTMVKSIQKQSPSGKAVKRYTPSKKQAGTARIVHPAKKGYAPNRDNGNLGNSLKFDKGELRAEAGTTGVIVTSKNGSYDYAKGLEETHPYIEPAFKKAEARYEKRVNRAIQRHIKGGN